MPDSSQSEDAPLGFTAPPQARDGAEMTKVLKAQQRSQVLALAIEVYRIAHAADGECINKSDEYCFTAACRCLQAAFAKET
jgi:hypothetical protein